MKNEILVKISIISLILSTLIFITTLLWMLSICKNQRTLIHTYENTIIESDYCNEEDCYTSYQKFIDYVNDRD